MKSKKTIFILVGIALLSVLLIVAVSKGWIGKKRGYKVETQFVTKGTIIEKISSSGKIQPETEVNISSDVSGEIIQLLVEEGDSVTEGQLLVKIKPDNYESMVDMALASVNSSKAALAQAKARLAQAKANHIKTEQEYQRSKKLLDQKVISQADFENVEAQYKVSLEEIESAKQSVRSAKFNIQNAQAQYKDARENLQKTQIYAPQTGIVSKLNVEQGERVVGTSQMAGTELLRIADLDNMEVRVNVNENDIIRVSKGDTAIIEVDSYNEEVFKGIVTAIASTAIDAINLEAVTEFEVKIKILPSSYKGLMEKHDVTYPFKPGMTASVDIISNVKDNVLKAPISAVTTRTEEDTTKEVLFVYNEEESTVKQQEISTGISDFDYIEVTKGIKDSVEVVTGPYEYVSKLLTDGDQVTRAESNKDKDRTWGASISIGK